MRRRGRVPLAGALGVTLACGGTTGGGPGAGGSSSAESSVCDEYFQSIIENETCQGYLPPPASELARLQGRFETLCSQTFALPGIGFTVSALEACVAAVKGTCAGGTPQNGACNSLETGSLALGASCVADAQCASGECSAGGESSDGGTTLCGTCLPPIVLGQSCAATQSCDPTAACTSGEDPTCVAITFGGVGVACDGNETQCDRGLYCDSLTGTCAEPGGAGAACNEDEACTPPLVCPPMGGSSTSWPSTCQSPGAAGAPCASDSDCASGLGCEPGTSQECATVSWAGAGQPCSATIRCLVGNCPFANETTGGICPTVIPDGQPCDGSETSICDTLASCQGGTCVLGYPSCP